LLLTAGSCWLLPACSVIVDSNSDQCESSTDCAAFPGTSCQDGVCLAGGAPCETNQQCIDDAGGQPAICRQSDRRCATLLTADCASVVPSPSVLSDDSTVVFGFMAPLVKSSDGQDFSSIGIPIKQGVELALSEIMTDTNGLPPVSGNGPPRPLAMLACHDLNDPVGTAQHLVNNVGVPAIFGPAFSGVAADVAQQVTIPGGTLAVSASATSPSLSTLDDNGLFWRTVPSDAIQAIPLAELVNTTEARIRDQLDLDPADQIKVAISYKDDAYGFGLYNALTNILRFNGKTPTANGANFVTVKYADPSGGATVDFPGAVAKMLAIDPHIVIPLGTNESITGIIANVEKAWDQGGYLPRYVCPDGGRLDEMLAEVDKDPALRGRVLGTVPGRKTDKYDAFALRFRAAYNDKAPGTYAENAYDSGYLVPYAVVALQDAALSGGNIAKGLVKMVGGTAVAAGPGGIAGAFQALKGGAAINYDGASGPLDFDTKVGEAPADIDTWCVVLNSQDKAAFLSTGQYYDAALDEIDGEISDQCCKLAGETCSDSSDCCSGTCDTSGGTPPYDCN
jgi:branched-chain amino acid transport system substrate-binding protein